MTNFTGQTVNSLRVGELVARNPMFKYAVTCQVCGSRGSASQLELTNGSAKCRASGCGKDALREALSLTPRKMREREKQRQRDLMAAAEKTLLDTHRKLNAVMRERLLGKVRDPDRIPVDPSTIGIKMTREQAAEFNRAEFRKFRDANPGVYWTPELLQNVDGYLEKNGLQIITANMLGRIIDRYRDAGLLPDAPVIEQEAEPAPAPEPVTLNAPPLPDGWMRGHDPETGAERDYSPTEINRMSADEFRRVFRVYADDLRLPNTGPGSWRA